MSESMKKKIIVYLVLLVMLFIWWRVEYKDAVTGFYEQAIEAGELNFTASISDIRYIVLTNNDISLREELDAEAVSVSVTIWSDDGEYYDATCQPLSIHTNGYTSTESTIFDDLPISLTEGKVYNIAYSAKLLDGTSLDQLSFLLYSDNRSVDRYSIILMFLIAVIFGLIIFKPFKFEVRFVLIWAMMLFLAMIVMPALMTERGYESKLADSERTAFANSYSISSGLIGKDKVDADGYVYIEESGIRNIGYTTYRVPLIRFWLDKSYGNYRSEGMVSYLFKADKGLHILSVPSAIVVALLRTISVGYRGIIIGGWLTGALITLILSLVAMKIAPKYKYFIGMLICLPSTLMMSMSYSGIGILIGIMFVIFAVLSRKFEDSNPKAYTYGLIAFLGIWAIANVWTNWDTDTYRTLAGGILGVVSTFDKWLFTMIAYDYEALYDVAVLPAYLILSGLVILSPLCSRWTVNMSSRWKKIIEALIIGLSCLIILIRYNQF